MRVALLYHGALPVERYGGTGRVVHRLARGLAELGHEVTLLAAPGSRVPEARLVPVEPRRAGHVDFDPRPLLPKGMEVLHAHRAIEVLGIPTLWTLHGTATRSDFPPNMVCLSADHAARSGASAFVSNGLDPSEYLFRRDKQPFDLFLGRLHSVKGWHWAVEGARRSGRRLVRRGAKGRAARLRRLSLDAGARE
jgi:glycosyltransferase involved in cell wall biosynthesis